MKREIAYKVILSHGYPVQIDVEEFEKVMNAIQKGVPVLVKMGLINPSFIVSVVPDIKRIADWKHECSYGDEHGDKARLNGMQPLESMMPQIENKKLLK